MIIAFSSNQKKLEIGKIVSFDNSNVIIHLFKNILQFKLIIWTVSEPQQLQTISRKLIIN